jgi:GT2 family glycosyltransferase
MIPVIIPYYRYKDQLDRCIAHLKSQTIELEIIIQGNNNINICFTAAVNEGLRKCLVRPCGYIVILNQNMYLEPTAVETMVTFMDRHPNCGIGAPLQIEGENPEYVISAGGQEAFPYGKNLHGRLSDFTEDEQIHWANGACMILRKDMIQEIGLLDENYAFIGSDSDYCFTARSRGWQIWRIAGAKGIHERGSSAKISEMRIEFLKIKDMLYFSNKWLTGGLYKELAYEGKNLSLEEMNRMISDLKRSESEFELLSSLSF